MFNAAITPKTYRLLKLVMAKPSFRTFYLAGGTALALQIGHRHSEGLDFFTSKEFSANLVNAFPTDYKTIHLFDNSIELIAEDSKVMFWYYGYQLRFKLKITRGLRLADPRDIGLMKLLVLQGRTSRKDIYDLYFVDREIIKLDKLLELFDKFYPKDKVNAYSSFKELLNIDVLKLEPDPILIKPVKWIDAFNVVSGAIGGYINTAIR